MRDIYQTGDPNSLYNTDFMTNQTKEGSIVYIPSEYCSNKENLDYNESQNYNSENHINKNGYPDIDYFNHQRNYE